MFYYFLFLLYGLKLYSQSYLASHKLQIANLPIMARKPHNGRFSFWKDFEYNLEEVFRNEFHKKEQFFSYWTRPGEKLLSWTKNIIKFVIFELTNGKWVGFSDSVMKPYNRLPLMDCHFALPASKRELKPSGSTSYSFLCTGRHYNIDIESLLLGGPVLYGLHHPLVPWDGEWHRGSDQGKFSSPDRRASVSIIHYIHQSLVDF